MSLSFSKFTNWCKSTELALFSAVPRLAIQYKIPLIFWGENPGLQLGDLKTLGKTGYDGNNLRFMNTLSGGGIEWIKEEGFEERILLPYLYPDTKEFENPRTPKANISCSSVLCFLLVQTTSYPSSHNSKTT